MSDERFDFASMREQGPDDLRQALTSPCHRTVRRAEHEISRRHRERLREDAARNRARALFWLSRHRESILGVAVILVIAFVIAFTLFMFV